MRCQELNSSHILLTQLVFRATYSFSLGAYEGDIVTSTTGGGSPSKIQINARLRYMDQLEIRRNLSTIIGLFVGPTF